MPYFFQENLSQNSFALSAEESKHISKAMRLKEGDFICLTDGKGTLAKATLSNVYKETCMAEIVERTFPDISSTKKLHLAVAPTKNPDRIEWLVEKAVEIGVSQISFIICHRSERKQVDLNRLQRISIAELKQAKSVWLPELKMLSLSQFMIENKNGKGHKFIAYCKEQEHAIPVANLKLLQHEVSFLIGPEGDFTPEEISIAKENGYQHISLGSNILRTETAALFVACRFAF
jgi:16S rRNA (uracil1498-N3)-methyltransferase